MRSSLPSRLGYVCTAAMSSTGDGLLMAEAVGAQIVNAESITYRTIAAGVDDVGRRNRPAQCSQRGGAIIVNKEGKRFASEIGDDEALVLGIQAQTGGVGYVIMDQAAMDARYDVSGLVYSQAPMKTSLPRRIRWKNWRKRWESMHQRLVATVEEYNASVEKGVDEAFGREKALSKLETSAFLRCQRQAFQSYLRGRHPHRWQGAGSGRGQQSHRGALCRGRNRQSGLSSALQRPYLWPCNG